MTATASCPRCGAQSPDEVRLCLACGAALDEPGEPRHDPGDGHSTADDRQPDAPRRPAAPVDWRRVLGAVAATLMVSAAGALAIYEVHRTMPAVPPGFERTVRIVSPPPPPQAGDEARLRHLRRPEPGAGFATLQPTPDAARPDTPTRPTAPAAPTAAAPSSPTPASGRPPPATMTGRSAQPAAPAARAGDRLAPIQQAQCGDQSLLARFVCNERVRLRFCRGRWNEHPDCEVAQPNPVN